MIVQGLLVKNAGPGVMAAKERKDRKEKELQRTESQKKERMQINMLNIFRADAILPPKRAIFKGRNL
jgi:hypothetical protein